MAIFWIGKPCGAAQQNIQQTSNNVADRSRYYHLSAQQVRSSIVIRSTGGRAGTGQNQTFAREAIRVQQQLNTKKSM
ncbi:MAG: hypothetical protein R3E08_11115 [Thiotrichaceae bacterium]